ncbi:MAG: hypothetical protein DHS20C21_12470 [Gemmatimonadota bacterium]|nr:MAG: hypothetical protein DHS20C21_12470 [Gemmatimonadota bacterium]
MSFQEKSLWLVLLSLMLVFGFYFSQVLPARGVDVMPQHIALFAAAVAFLVITQIAGHVLLAIIDRRSDTDERDTLIALKGTRNAAYVLAVGVFLALTAGVATRGNFIFTHVLLASWVLAQLVETGSQLFLYRRGS